MTAALSKPNGPFTCIKPLLVFPEHKVPLPGGKAASQCDIWILAKDDRDLENELIPGAVIKGARFKGKTMLRFLDMKDFKGNLIAAVNEVLDFIQRHISMGVGIGAKAARDEKWDYPLEALREDVVNAIVHRDYTDPGNIQIRIFDDRLEIWSPGLLPKELNIKNLLSEKTVPSRATGGWRTYSMTSALSKAGGRGFSGWWRRAP